MDKVVYHGSPNGNIEKLIAHKSTHLKNCIYATDNKAVAFLFMGKGKGDLDTRISNEGTMPILVERRANILNDLYNKEGYLYELDGSTFEHYDFLWKLEVISFEKAIKPIRKIYYPNILDAINEEERNGNIIIYRYPNRPEDMPLDNSDLIELYMHYEEMGLNNSISTLLETYPEFSSLIENSSYKKK